MISTNVNAVIQLESRNAREHWQNTTLTNTKVIYVPISLMELKYFYYPTMIGANEQMDGKAMKCLFFQWASGTFTLAFQNQ